MSATVSRRSTHPWAASHRSLLAALAVAIAVAATVVIVLVTSAASPSRVQAPDRGQPVPTVPGPAQPRGPQQPDFPRRCLQHMGLQYMPAMVPC